MVLLLENILKHLFTLKKEYSMKKALFVLLAIAFSAPLLVGAVTLTKDSNIFSFPGIGVKYQVRMNPAQAGFRALPGVRGGAVVLQYKIPQNEKNATLSIYNLAGTTIDVIKLPAGSASVRWNVAKSRSATGIYLAALRYGVVESRLQFSLVK
jgi:hypothetical protein